MAGTTVLPAAKMFLIRPRCRRYRRSAAAARQPPELLFDCNAPLGSALVCKVEGALLRRWSSEIISLPTVTSHLLVVHQPPVATLDHEKTMVGFEARTLFRVEIHLPRGHPFGVEEFEVLIRGSLAVTQSVGTTVLARLVGAVLCEDLLGLRLGSVLSFGRPEIRSSQLAFPGVHVDKECLKNARRCFRVGLVRLK